MRGVPKCFRYVWWFRDVSANSFKFLSIVYIREPGINKRKVIQKNTTKCRKHQRNLIIREYRIPPDVII